MIGHHLTGDRSNDAERLRDALLRVNDVVEALEGDSELEHLWAAVNAVHDIIAEVRTDA